VTALLPAPVLLATGWIAPSALLASILVAALAAIWLGRKLHKRLGGYTGDCLGAVQQLAEALIYVGVLATLGHGAWA
jgi:adenosylcobinamide-GDP ribazoletransferase